MKTKKNNKQMRCPYCGATVMLRDASFVYGKNALEKKVYVCSNYPSCDSYVGVLPHNNEPKGTLANGELRNLRIHAHHVFDEIWKRGIMSRKDAYRWMRDQFFMTGEQAHIGNFSEYMCQRLMEKSQALLEQHNKGTGGKKMNIHLNAEQRKMVEENLSVIQKVISKHVMLNESVDGMGYDDINQIGSIGLCKAAVTYRSGSDASFQTYAFSVVRNEIYNHLRSIVNKQKAKLTDIAEKQALVSSEQTPEERIEDQAALDALRLSKERYQGVAKCGIEALELKLKGYSGAEIAKMYQVKPNYIAACICRAVKYLKKDKAFFADLGK